MTIRPTRPVPPDRNVHRAGNPLPLAETGPRACRPASPPPRDPLLPRRSAVVIALAADLGALAAVLAQDGTHLTAAVSLGGAVAAAVLPVLNRIVE